MRAEVELHARRASLVHDWDGRWKLASLGLVAVVLVAVRSPVVAGCGAAFAIGLLGLARIPGRVILGRLGAAQALLLPCLFILPLAMGGDAWAWGPLRLSHEGLRQAVLLYLRALAILTLGLVVVYSTPMVVLVHTLQRFRLPRALVVITLLTYRYLFTLWWELTRVRWALATRGFRPRGTMRSHRTLANVVGMSLVRSLERTERIHCVLQCRGFDGRLRTLHRFHSGAADWLKAAACAGVAAGLLMLDAAEIPKSEIRNPKEIRSANAENPKPAGSPQSAITEQAWPSRLRVSGRSYLAFASNLGLRISGFLRTSDFGFRIRFGFRTSSFGLLSDFGFRISDFKLRISGPWSGGTR